MVLVFIITGFISCKDRSADENRVMAEDNGKSTQGTLYRGHTFSKGLALAKETGKPMVLYFYTTWCGYCRAMDKMVFSDSEVAEELREKFVYVRIDTESSEEIRFKNHNLRPMEFGMMMGVQGFPTTVYLDKDLAVITKIPGFMNRDVFLNLLSYISAKCYTKNVSFDNYDRKNSPCSSGGK